MYQFSRPERARCLGYYRSSGTFWPGVLPQDRLLLMSICTANRRLLTIWKDCLQVDSKVFPIRHIVADIALVPDNG